MRKLSIQAAVIAAFVFAVAGMARSQVPGNGAAGGYGNGAAGYGMEACDPCADYGGGGGHRRHGHHQRQSMEGLSASFNCGCNGSYKFPVPPLYTYHWPGQYSHQHMTDYHSPWRFPPLKPYSDELPAVEMGMDERSLDRVRTVSATAYEVRPVGQMEAMSDRMLRLR